MSNYAPPLDEIRFALDHVLDLDRLFSTEKYGELDAATIHEAIGEAGRFFAEVLGPLRRIGDQQGSYLQADGTVKTPDGWKEAYAKMVEAGWGSLVFDPNYGGGGFPETIGIVLQEIMVSANMAFSMGPLLTQGAIHAIESVADEMIVEKYLEKLVTGEWTGTMNLTEPEAGSDVGALRTKAEPVGDGSYKITGQKIFISYGDHDMTDNIVHLVLARTPNAPAGTKGISCFVVPKRFVNDDGTLGETNDVRCVLTEHKMGINASPTCVMSFGDEDGAVGWLLGNEFDGMRVMFVMMNMARISVGVQGLGLGEIALQSATTYANERLQGRAPGAPKGESSPIVDHPDVRRMLLFMRSHVEAMRLLCYLNTVTLDLSQALADDEDRQAAAELTELLIPITKAWCTDMGVEATSTAIQIYGGMGFIEESGVAQLFRDARIAPIYEGTNGIQALDLVARKLPMRMGGVVNDYLATMRSSVEELRAAEGLEALADRLEAAIGDMDTATKWIFENAGNPLEVMSGATSYQRLVGVVTAGWLLARSALAAQKLVDSGDTSFPAGFAEQKIITAKFYAEQYLPATSGWLAQSVGGSELLMHSAF